MHRFVTLINDQRLLVEPVNALPPRAAVVPTTDRDYFKKLLLKLHYVLRHEETHNMY